MAYLNNNQFFKHSYDKAMGYLVPYYIFEDDRSTFGEEVELKDQIVNCHISIAENIDSLLNISSITGTVSEGLDHFSGISKYFIKQNNLTEITTDDFNKHILSRLNTKLSNFETSAELQDYLLETLLPSIALNNPTEYFCLDDDQEAIHNFLVSKLSWLYFLNTSGTTYSPSSFVSDIIISKLYKGSPVQLVDCIDGLSEYVWKNNLTNYFPSTFASSQGEFTSGTLQLEKLKTWNSIVYSPLFADKDDKFVKDRFDLYADNSLKITNKTSAGAFNKLLKGMSLMSYDINNKSEIVGSLYDIDQCPDEYLPLLANLIGWKLFGTNPDRWRLQLRNAVQIYKTAGTKQSIQFAVNTVFPKDTYPVSSNIKELWESYIPYLIYYSLATESPYFESNQTWTPELARSLAIDTYAETIDENIRLAVDRIVLETYIAYPEDFRFPTDMGTYVYRGREYPIPPFEEYPWYVNTTLTESMVRFIADRLVCFGVPNSFALQLIDYVLEYLFYSQRDTGYGAWLFFLEDYYEAPNASSLLADLARKYEYVSLWCGKSSHFSILLDAGSYNFNEVEETTDSPKALQIISEAVKQFSPAHAIPIINLNLNASDVQITTDNFIPIIDIVKSENLEHSKAISNYYTSSLTFNLYTRNNTGGQITERQSFDSLQDSTILNATSVGDIPRSTLRKRSYDNLLPKDGYYDRTGFNMPILWNQKNINHTVSSFPLGFVPSSLEYKDINNYASIPDEYNGKKVVDLYYLIGDSIAEGYGGDASALSSHPFSGVYSNVEGCYIFREFAAPGSESWEGYRFEEFRLGDNTNTNPLKLGTEDENNFGPEISLIHNLRKNSDRDIYLIKLGIYGSLPTSALTNAQGNLSVHWSVSSESSLQAYPLFSSMVCHGLSWLQKNNIIPIYRGGVINLGTNLPSYWSDLSQASSLIRSDFSSLYFGIDNLFESAKISDIEPNVIWVKPIPLGENIYSSIGYPFGTTPGPENDFYDYVRDEIDRLESLYPQFHSIEYSGLSSTYPSYMLQESAPLKIHLNLSGQIEFGNMLFNKFNEVSQKVNYYLNCREKNIYNCDRGQLDPIYAVMHKLKERQKYFIASSIIGSSIDIDWKEVYQSYANSQTETDGWFPVTTKDYFNFEFGRSLHKLYKIYCSEFNRHQLAEHLLDLDGPNIFSHTYGPLLYNHDLNSTLEDFVTTSLDNQIILKSGGELFSTSGYTSGTYAGSSLSSVYIDRFEFINSSILSAVDLVHTSGTGDSNEISLYRLQKNDLISRTLQEKTLLKIVSKTGLPRVRFDVSRLIPDSNYPLQSNFLLPDHEFKIDINHLITNYSGRNLGGRSIGVWIRTKPENNKVWSFVSKEPEKSRCSPDTPFKGAWVQHSLPVSKEDLLNEYCHTIDIPERSLSTSSITIRRSKLDQFSKFAAVDSVQKFREYELQCLDLGESWITLLGREDFENISLYFNTNNKDLAPDRSYGSTYGQVHRKNQEYIIEVFLLPSQQSEQFIVLDSVSITDLTLNKLSKVLLLNVCPEILYDLKKDELYSIFRYWNNISGKNSPKGLASRNAAITSDVLHTNGGSRLDYRVLPSWEDIEYHTDGGNDIIIKNINSNL